MGSGFVDRRSEARDRTIPLVASFNKSKKQQKPLVALDPRTRTLAEMWTMNHSLEPDVSQSLKRQGDHHGVYRSTGNEVGACTSNKGMTQLNMGPLVISHALYFLVVSRE